MTERALTGPHASTPVELKERLEAERRGTPFLLFRDDAGRQRIVELEGGGPLTVGRRPENDVALPWDHEVSRVHAQLELVGREWSLVDDGISRNAQRDLLVTAATEPFNVVLLALLLIAGALLDALPLMIPLALIVYGAGIARSMRDPATKERAKLRGRDD